MDDVTLISREVELRENLASAKVKDRAYERTWKMWFSLRVEGEKRGVFKFIVPSKNDMEPSDIINNVVLRPYQKQAVSKLLWAKNMEGADLCVLPTGAGKSLVIASLAHQLGQSILILQPTKEILEQNVEKMRKYVPDSEIGIYSASMNRKDKSTYTFATIQSIYKKPDEFKTFRYVIIDECHLVDPKNLDGMFMRFLEGIGNPKVVGLTATPYRMAMGYYRDEWDNLVAYTTTKIITRMKTRFWHRLIFNINNEDLINEGYLLPLRYYDRSVIDHKDIPKNISKSDFDLVKYEAKIRTKEDEILEAIFLSMELSKHVLVFCSSVEQAEGLSEIVDGSAVVSAKTSKAERERIVEEFRSGAIQTVFNVGVFTTGFDFPELDGIVLLRPTKSIGLFYQMLGRGVRKVDGKKPCRVIDLSGTVKEIGRIETIKLIRREKWELESECGSWHNRVLYETVI